MAKQQSKKQGKKVAKKSVAKKTAAKKAAPVIRDGVCKACDRFIRVVGKGRCECGQAYLVRGGKLTRINETPKGCVKNLPEAATLKQAEQVLAEAGEPLGCQEIVKRMLDQGLWATSGKTPHATIYSALLRDLQKNGEGSRFRKVDRGRFTVAK